MSTLRGSTHQALATHTRLRVRPVTIALAAGGGNDNGGPSSVRVTPSAPIPPSPTERQQPAGLNGPGMCP